MNVKELIAALDDPTYHNLRVVVQLEDPEDIQPYPTSTRYSEVTGITTLSTVGETLIVIRYRELEEE